MEQIDDRCYFPSRPSPPEPFTFFTDGLCYCILSARELCWVVGLIEGSEHKSWRTHAFEGQAGAMSMSPDNTTTGCLPPFEVAATHFSTMAVVK